MLPTQNYNRATLIYLLIAFTMSWALPAQAQGLSRVSGPQKSLIKDVRHEVVVPPRHGVFDNLAFRVNGSQVELYGQVTRPTLKTDAERVVRQIKGVRVVNNIKVLPVSPNDDRIRMNAFRAIYGHPALSRYATQAVPPIHIIVKNGHLTLEGVVTNESDKKTANVQANSVPSVLGVTNNLRVEATESPG